MEAILAWRGGSCTNSWPYCKGSAVLEEGPRAEGIPEGRISAVPTARGGCGCKTMLDGALGWLFHGVATAFFASLQRCSCFNIETKDDSIFDDSDHRYLVAFSSDDDHDHELEISK